ncbi:MAG: hypothetical protein WC208_14795 [Gallionella sp.]|jgi:hypothetical protein
MTVIRDLKSVNDFIVYEILMRSRFINNPETMSIASSRIYIATYYNHTLDLWNPTKAIRTVHSTPDLTIIKVECNYQGGIALTDTGKVIFFTHTERLIYHTDEFITDISSSEKDLIMTTLSGQFIRMGKRGGYLKTSRSPLSVSVGSAKIAYITCGHLYMGEVLIPHKLPIVQVSVGGGHTIFLDVEGGLYGFGCNKKGQLGRGLIEYAHRPVKLPFWTEVKKIVAGNEHTVILDTKGDAWMCGVINDKRVGLKAQTVDDCLYGFFRFRGKILDVSTNSNMTFLLHFNGDIEQLGGCT